MFIIRMGDDSFEGKSDEDRKLMLEAILHKIASEIARVEMLQAFINCIGSMGDDGIPAGELYSKLAKQMPYGAFTEILRTLVKEEMITQSETFVLKAVMDD